MCMALAGIYTAGIVVAAPLQALPATLDTMAGADGDPVATLASPPSEHYGSVPGGLIKTSHRAEAGKGKIYQQGEASWYGPGFHGRKTANGERFNQEALTAAHRKLPLGTRISVRNLDNGATVNLRINDRGPYAGGRILDVSKAAARELGMLQSGTATVQIRILH